MSAQPNTEAQRQDQPTRLLIGLAAISRYCGVSEWAIWNWRKKHGFPAAPMPDGRIATTESLIDQWVIARMDLETCGRRVEYRPSAPDTDDQSLTSES